MSMWLIWRYRGYLESCREIVGAAKTIAARIRSEFSNKLYVLGSPPASVIAFGSVHPQCNIHEVGDIMSKKGWHLNGIVRPDAIHIAVTVSCGHDACLPVLY